MATINGTAGIDTLTGTAEADIINGLEGDDLINWSAGADTINGGAGRDRYKIGPATIALALNDDLSVAISGTFRDVPGSPAPGTNFTTTLSGVEEIVLQTFDRTLGLQDVVFDLVTGTQGNDVILSRNGANEVFVTGRGVDTVSYENWTRGVNVVADEQVENLKGTTSIDTLRGNALANILDGGNDNDRLIGVGGNDWLTGGSGIDTAVIETDSTGWTANRDATGQNIVLWKGSEFYILNGIETIQFNDKSFTASASGDFNLSGTPTTPTGALEVRGTSGNDTFNDLTGTKHYFGGDGIDTVVFPAASTSWNINKTADGAGYVVWNSADFRVLNQVEKVTFTDKTVYLNGAGTQHIVATEANTAFYIGESSTSFGVGKTLDGSGLVVWKGADFDVLNNIDQIVFTDKVVLASDFGL